MFAKLGSLIALVKSARLLIATLVAAAAIAGDVWHGIQAQKTADEKLFYLYKWVGAAQNVERNPTPAPDEPH